jgi:hypothetical protein
MKFEKSWFYLLHRQDNYLSSKALRLALGSTQQPR